MVCDDYWWAHLPAVPTCPNSPAYKRLRRVWFEHTWPGHPFFDTASEVHLVATLFENFVILPRSWVKELASESQLDLEIGQVAAVNWGYEVWGKSEGPDKCADIAIHFRDEKGCGVIVVEAKKPGGVMGAKDCNPNTYLDLQSFSFAKTRRRLLYLVDEEDLPSMKNQIKGDPHLWSMYTWQQLGGLQIRLALEACTPLNGALRGFVAGAIQYQFARHGIRPNHISAPYLGDEYKKGEINHENLDKLTAEDWWAQDWKIASTEGLYPNDHPPLKPKGKFHHPCGCS